MKLVKRFGEGNYWAGGISLGTACCVILIPTCRALTSTSGTVLDSAISNTFPVTN
jgi:hypothetical protein